MLVQVLFSFALLFSLTVSAAKNAAQAKEVCKELMNQNMHGPRLGGECYQVVNGAQFFELPAIEVCAGILADGREYDTVESLRGALLGFS